MAVRSQRVLNALVLGGGLAVLGAAGRLFGGALVSPFPPPSQMKIRPDEAVEAAQFLSLGMRRQAADLAFVRLLQYYGTPEGEFQFAYLVPMSDEDREGPYEGGVYPELYARAVEIADLDPYFEHAVLYAAGALAFNVNRPQEAIELLERVRRRDKDKWKYDALMAAIGFQKAREPQRVADSLLPVALDPDSPAMVKQETAFLLKRIGRRSDALKVYRVLLDTTKDEGYLDTARRNISELSRR